MTENLLDPNSTNEPQNYLTELVGDDKKFKDVEALAKGKFESDRFIEFKNREFDQLKEHYLQLKAESDARAKLEDLINQLSEQKTNTNSNNTPDANVNQPIDPNQIKSLVSNAVQELDMTRKQEANWNMVKSKLEDHYGSNFQNVLRQETQSLGISEQEVNDLARRNPQVLLRALGIDQQQGTKQSFQAPPRSESRASFKPNIAKHDHLYYENLRQTDPAKYWDSKTQVQMHKDISEQGPEAFYGDPDWILK